MFRVRNTSGLAQTLKYHLELGAFDTNTNDPNELSKMYGNTNTNESEFGRKSRSHYMDDTKSFQTYIIEK